MMMMISTERSSDQIVQRMFSSSSGDCKMALQTSVSDGHFDVEEHHDRQDIRADVLMRVTAFAGDVSMLGVRYISDSGRSVISRLIWLVLVLGGIGLALYQIHDRILYYTTHPTSTIVELVDAPSIRFPQVTICNENEIRLSAAEKHGITETVRSMYSPWELEDIVVPNLSGYNALNLTGDQYYALKKELSQSVDKAINGCSWSGIRCDKSWFTPVITRMGSCFAFNAASYNLSTTRAGAIYGLKLVLVVDQPNYLVADSPAAGFRVLLHEPDEVPLVQQLGFLVSPGYCSSVAITLFQTKLLGPPYGTCRDDDNGGYRQSVCVLLCETQFLVRRCRCRFSYMSGEAPLCNVTQEFYCGKSAMEDYITNVDGRAQCNCPPQCFSRAYDVTISQAVYSKFFLNFLTERIFKNSMPKDYLIDNSLVLQIYFSTLQYLEMTSKPAYPPTALLSDIGGAMGLLLGATLLTVYEVLEFALQLGHHVALARRRRQ